MKKLMTLILALVFVASFALCVQAEETKLLGVFMPSADHGFTAESIEQAKGALELTRESHADFDYVLYNTAEASEQMSQIMTALDMYEFDVIMLWPIDGAPLYNAASMIVEREIPLVVYDRMIPDLEATAEMTGDQIAVGTGAANYIKNYFADRIAAGETIYGLEFQGDTSQAAVERTESFMDNKGDNVEVVQSFLTMWSRETGYNDMTDWLSNTPKEDIEKVSFIYTHDDEPTLGILDAIAQYQGDAELNIEVLIGVGGMKDVLDAMQPSLDNYGIHLMTNTYAPGMIRQCVDLTVGIMYGSGETGMHLVPVEQIDLENEAEYRQSDEYKFRYPDAE